MATMVGLRFDLRVPSFAKTTPERQYAACLDMCQWADGIGLDAIAISEHHGVADGYMSAPVALAASIAARTKRIRINIAAVLVPLHDPIRLAALGVEPPTRTSGGDAGFGVTRTERPRHVNGSPVHACCSTPTYSSKSFPRCVRSTPAISNSS